MLSSCSFAITWNDFGLKKYQHQRGQGRDRTGDLPLFRRSLVPTELPGRALRDPDGT